MCYIGSHIGLSGVSLGAHIATVESRLMRALAMARSDDAKRVRVSKSREMEATGKLTMVRIRWLHIYKSISYIVQVSVVQTEKVYWRRVGYRYCYQFNVELAISCQATRKAISFHRPSFKSNPLMDTFFIFSLRVLPKDVPYNPSWNKLAVPEAPIFIMVKFLRSVLTPFTAESWRAAVSHVC